MKLLVCTDGSPDSAKALEKAVEIAGGCRADEVTVISVIANKYSFPETTTDRLPLTSDDIKHFENILELERKEKNIMLAEAAKLFDEIKVNVNILIESGHPAETIARVAAEGNYDMIIIGSRGLGGLKKFFLGSVSNAVLQEASCSVLVVK
jgi:nucleotide-binding universal stress UspA family protein